MSWPATTAVPRVAGMNPVRMRIVVVFPAPFGPRKPSTSPFATENERSLTAVKRPNSLVMPETSITVKSSSSFAGV